MPSTSVDEETEYTPPGNTADVDEKTTAEHEAVEGGEEAERDSEVLWGAVGDSDVGPGIDEECFVASIEHASHPFALVKTSVVALSGLIVAATIRFLTGRGKDGGGKSDSRQRVEPAEEEEVAHLTRAEAAELDRCRHTALLCRRRGKRIDVRRERGAEVCVVDPERVDRCPVCSVRTFAR